MEERQRRVYKVLYGRKCRSPVYWDEVEERKILGLELMEETVEMIKRIRDRIKIAQDRHKSYANKRRKDLHFEVGDKVLLKVAPMKEVLRFGKKGKLRPRFIEPFEILERIRDVTYRLVLSPELSSVDNMFHVSMLRKYLHDPSHVVSHEEIELNKDLTYEEVPIAILDRKVHELRNR